MKIRNLVCCGFAVMAMIGANNSIAGTSCTSATNGKICKLSKTNCQTKKCSCNKDGSSCHWVRGGLHADCGASRC